MTTHLCRDILIGGTLGGATGAYDSMWTANVFLQGTLGFTQIQSAGNVAIIPPAYQDTVVTYHSATQIGPNSWTYAQISSSIIDRTTGSCFINLGTGKEFYVQFSTDVMNLSAAAYPIGYPSVSASFPVGSNPWLNKWICLKSKEFPLANSGIFDVISQSYSDNAIIINFRAHTGSYPSVQTGSFATASFWLPPPGSDHLNGYNRTHGGYAILNAAGPNGLSNDVTGRYGTSGSLSAYPRIILESPHSTRWQLRMCLEDTNDLGNPNDWALSMVPGFGAVNAEFPIGKFETTGALHLHPQEWYDIPGGLSYPSFTHWSGLKPGLDRSYKWSGFPRINDSENWRFRARMYIWGDDETGSCAMFLRTGSNGNMSNGWLFFGIPEDEPDPLPGSHPVHRLFMQGITYYNAFGDISWRTGEYNTYGAGGAAYSLNLRQGPIPCVFAPLTSIAFVQSSYNPWGLTADQPIFSDKRMLSSSFSGGARELIPVDIVAGAWDNMYINGYPPRFPLEIRRLGSVPFARMGSHFGVSGVEWVTADDDRTWFHVKNGIYMPWGGVIPLP